MSHQSANENGDNGMKPRTVHRSPEIYLRDEKKPGKPQLGESHEAVRPVIASNETPDFEKSVGLHSTQGRKKGGKKKRVQILNLIKVLILIIL